MSSIALTGTRGEGLARLSLGLFCLILVWAPLPLGSNRPWAWSLLVLAVAVTGFLAALLPFVQRRRLAPPPSLVIAGLAFFAVATWAWLQMLPVWSGEWIHPAWAALEPFGIPDATGSPADGGRGAITLDLDRTRDALMRLLGYLGAFVVAFVLARDAAAARYILLAILGTTTMVSAYGLFMVFGGGDLLPFGGNTAYRGVVTGTFINRNNFATYANLGLLIGFVWLFEPFLRDVGRHDLRVLLRELLERLLAERGLLLFALLVLASASLLSASRGGFLSVTAAILTVLLLLFLLTRPRFLALVIATPLIGGALWGMVALSGDTVLERFKRISDARTDIWEVTATMIDDRFWIGHGYGTYETVFYAYRDDRFPLVVDKAHNTYLEHAAELGMPATVLLYAGAVLLFVRCWHGVFERRRDKSFPLIAVAASVLVAVHGVVDFSLQIPAVAVTYAALLGVGVAQSTSSRRTRRAGRA